MPTGTHLLEEARRDAEVAGPKVRVVADRETALSVAERIAERDAELLRRLAR